MPNQFADQLEYFIRKLPGRDSAIISLHPHNDRGTGVATAELGLLAGAERVEATLFGNGERTGNVDMVTLAMNMYTQGVDPQLDFSRHQQDPGDVRAVHQDEGAERQPYAGELVFTAFSGSHQDAINKGTHYMQEQRQPTTGRSPICPSTRRTWAGSTSPSSASTPSRGKGGAAFVMQHNFGFDLPKAMHPEFGAHRPGGDRPGGQGAARPSASIELFKEEYIDATKPYELLRHSFARS